MINLIQKHCQVVCHAALFLMLLCFMHHDAEAAIVESSMPLVQRIHDADVIVVAQIVSYTADKPAQKSPKVSPSKESFGVFTTFSSEFQKAGHYVFEVRQIIKGECRSTVKMHLNALDARYYGYNISDVKEGSIVILLLKPSGADYKVVDSLTPIILLSTKYDDTLDEKQEKIASEQQVYNFLLASLSRPAVRRSSLFHLRSVKNNKVADIVSDYVDDNDIEVKDSALYCMMVNQRVEFIPKVLKLSEELGETGQSPECLLAFKYLKVPEATPYLNKMLFSEYYYLRLHAIFALDDLRDKSSIPYLIVALSDPDPQYVIASNAYYMIYRAAPDLKEPKSEEYFYANREKEIDIVYRWWRGYLSGENALKGLKRGLLHDSDLSSSLYSLDVDDRKKAIKSLSEPLKLANVPYVMVSLSDPDEEVAFDSYVLLKSIIKTLPDIKSAHDFEKESERVMRDSRSWWMQKLKDRLEE